jgi:phytoene/squalene synthetase
MPPEVQPDIELFIQGGRAILRKIERQGYNVLEGRPALASWEKLGLISRVLWKKVKTSLPWSPSRQLRQP